MSACPTWPRWRKRSAYGHARSWIWISTPLRCTATTYEPHLQRANVRLLYDRFDRHAPAERLVTDFPSHVYFPAELELLFLSAGFEIVQQYGDYQFVRVDRMSPYTITVARRPRQSDAASV
jgi:hypothetical protein